MNELFLYFLIIGILKEVIVQILVKTNLEDSSLRAAIIFPEAVSISAVCSLIHYQFEDIMLVCWCPLSWELQLCSVCCVIWVPSAAYSKESTVK